MQAAHCLSHNKAGRKLLKIAVRLPMENNISARPIDADRPKFFHSIKKVGAIMIDFVLSAEEVRVLGALLEKGMATPEYYPLTLNALTNACNQKSNRNPVVVYDEETVAEAVAELIDKRLAVRSDTGRVTKYAECFAGNAKLINREAALLCLLLLRGAQTPGELRGRSERLHPFGDLAEVNETLDDLAEMALVRKLPRQPGRKESRFIHLLGGEVEEEASVGHVVGGEGEVLRKGKLENVLLEELTAEVASLREEVHNLRQQFLEFRSQFD